MSLTTTNQKLTVLHGDKLVALGQIAALGQETKHKAQSYIVSKGKLKQLAPNQTLSLLIQYHLPMGSEELGSDLAQRKFNILCDFIPLCAWSEPSYTYYQRGEQTPHRGRRLSIIGFFQSLISFIYGLDIGGISRKSYIQMIEQEAFDAQKTGRIRVIVQYLDVNRCSSCGISGNRWVCTSSFYPKIALK